MKIILTDEQGRKYNYKFNGSPSAVVGRGKGADFKILIPQRYKVQELERAGNLGYLRETPKAMFVSRYHCSLEYDGRRLNVRDLRSENGTYVDGHRLNGESVELKDNSVLSLGTENNFRVKLVDGEGLLDKLKGIFG